MKKIAVLFTKLQQQGIRIKLVDDQLVVEYGGNELPTEIKVELQANKLEIIEFLRANTEQQKAYSEIVTVEKQVAYPLSNAQKRLWVLEQLGDLGATYHIIGAYRFTGELDREIFQRTCVSLIERHESLRTRFVLQNNEPMQQIMDMTEVNFEVNFEKLNNDDENFINEKIQKENEKLFDLEAGVLFRIKVLSINPELNILVYTLHHIIADGWSGTILGSELSTLYNAYLKGEDNPLSPLKVQYKDFAHWQNLQISNKWADDAKEYWLSKFEDEIPILEFPTDFSRPIIKSYKGAIIRDYWSHQEFDLLQNFAQSQSVSMFMLMLAGLNVLLNKYTGQTDMVVGVPVSGREHNDLNNQIGYYINAIPLRNTIQSEDYFTDYLSQIKEKTLQAFQHQNYPINLLSEELKIPRDASRSPLFDVWLDYHNFNVDDSIKLRDSALQAFDLQTQTCKFDFSLMCEEKNDKLFLSLNYNTDLFLENTAIRLLAHFKKIISSIVADSAFKIKQLDYLSNSEIEQQLFDFVSEKSPQISDKTLIKLLEEQVEKSPNSVAIICQGEQLTYRQLNERANFVASKIKADYQLVNDSPIGLILKRNEFAIIGILGILKAGFAYLPIDMDYPSERIQYMLDDANVELVITETDYFAKLLDFYGKEVYVIDIEPLEEVSQNVLNSASIADLAYIIYTSGSTGNPKGVGIQNRSIVHYLQWANTYYFQNEEGFHTALFTSLSFDLTLTTIFSTLLRGDSMMIFPENDSPNNLKEILTGKNNVKFIKLTPSHIGLIRYLNLEATQISHVIVGGEALNTTHIETLQQINPTIRIFNEYGPTETTVGCTVEEVQNSDKITIGKPISNTQIYVLDANQKLLPVGASGEIYIGGIGLAKGYINQEILTKNKFVKHPFVDGERLYRTGDLAKWLPDGRLDYLGRIDNQVKIRGFRIELGEIENALKANPLIKNAVVLCMEDLAKEKYLVAYLEGGDLLTTAEWREYIRQKLPDYMIPTYFIEVEKWDLTSNGKFNTKLLPDPLMQQNQNDKVFEEPQNEIEWKVYNIIKDALSERNIQNIDIHENFFDVGMDSLKVVKSFKIIDEVYPNVIKVHEVFSYPTIKKLASLISERTETVSELVENNIEILEF